MSMLVADFVGPQGGATIQDGSHITKIQFGRSEEQKKYMEQAPALPPLPPPPLQPCLCLRVPVCAAPQVATILNAQAEAAAEPETTYSEQILNAFKPNGGEGDTTATDWAWHAVSVFWKERGGGGGGRGGGVRVLRGGGGVSSGISVGM
eukprot:3022527-Pleurochrysis_carterae.AAC.1